MRILFLTDNFPPESNAPATRTYEHCMSWVKMGVDVTVITCQPNFPAGKIFDGYSNKLYRTENIEGIKVVRVWSYISANKGFVKRILDYVSYAVMSFIFGLFIRTDVIIATSPQFFTAVSGRLLSLFKRKPWIMEVRDLWPDSIVAVGSMKSKSKIFRFLKKIESHLYRSAQKIVVVTDSFKEYLIDNHKIAAEKIGVFKNGVRSNFSKYNNSQNVSILRKRLGLEDKVVVSYIGTHGMAHALDFILRCTQKVEDNNIHFIFVGDGAEKESLVKYGSKLKKKNFTFLDSVPKNKIIDFISLSNYALVNLKRSNEFKNVIPSKIFENIAMYKPILLGVEGEAKNLIETYNVGVCYIPEDEKSFLKALIEAGEILNGDFKSNCDIMLKDFDRSIIAKKMINFIQI